MLYQLSYVRVALILASASMPPYALVMTTGVPIST